MDRSSNPSSSSGESASTDRQNRYQSHALVEIRRFKHLPFGVHSAVLLDLSLGGFKAEFTGDVKAKPGDRFWLNILLSPLGIFAPTRLLCSVECRWFDDKRLRVGGVFTQLTKTDSHILEAVISVLKDRGGLVG